MSLMLGGAVVYLVLMQPPKHQSLTKIRWANIKRFTGTIESVTFRAIEDKAGAEITIVDKNLRRLTSIVTEESQILDVQDLPIPLSSLEKDLVITEQYIVTKDGINIVKSIRILMKPNQTTY